MTNAEICGTCFAASDGTLFYPAMLHSKQDKRIGIVEETSNSRHVYPDYIFANLRDASETALELRNAYDEFRSNPNPIIT